MSESLLVSFCVSGSVVDANVDHHFIINNVLALRHGEKTPYLFSALPMLGKRFYCVYAHLDDLNSTFLANKSVKESQGAIEKSGDGYGFDAYIRINPAVKIKQLDAKREFITRNKPIKDRALIVSWFEKKLKDQCIDVLDCSVLHQSVMQCSKGNTVINEAYVKFKAAAESESILHKLIDEGVGKRKGFGYGLPILKGTNAYEVFEQTLKPGLTPV
jgi:hypothetical protein